MKKIYNLLFLIIAFNGYSQSFPYLNASTGNENEFPVDQDTNIYMFHGNRLVKTDKNFNTIWAKTYSGFVFSNLLLSKTGSMFFLGRNTSNNIYGYFGKLDKNGNVSWIKNTQGINAVLSGSTSVTYSVDCKGILLDRNDHLVITGSNGSGPSAKGFLLKTDTNGNTLKFKSFNWVGISYLNQLSIVSDSMGYYKLIGSGYLGMGPGEYLAAFSYSDQTDVFVSSREFFYYGIPFGFSWRLLKSKFNGCFYIHTSVQTPATSMPYTGIARFDAFGKLKWYNTMMGVNGTSYAIAGYAEELDNGDIFYSASTGPAMPTHTSAFIKLDSSGVFVPGMATSMLNGYNYFPSWPMGGIPSSAREIYANNYYFDVSGGNFATNPLTIQKFSSSLTWSCSASVGCSISSSTSTPTQSMSSSTVEPVTSYTIPAFNTTVTPVTFSVNPNFCLVMNTDEMGQGNETISVYPNPATEKIVIETEWDEIAIRDISGKEIKIFRSGEEIAVGDLANGIYFLRIKTSGGELNQKFIKN